MNALYDHDSRQAENDVASSRFEPGVSAPSRIMVRAKLEMTTPGDSDEQEAEAMADAVVREGKIARSVSAGHSGGGVAMPSQMGGRLSALQGHGSRLYGELKDHMETGFGRDFSDVSLHTDDAAAEMSSSIGARAFTYGSDIYFGRGQFSPDTTAGQHLLAHELAHVSQGTGKVARAPEETEENTSRKEKEKKLSFIREYSTDRSRLSYRAVYDQLDDETKKALRKSYDENMTYLAAYGRMVERFIKASEQTLAKSRKGNIGYVTVAIRMSMRSDYNTAFIKEDYFGNIPNLIVLQEIDTIDTCMELLRDITEVVGPIQNLIICGHGSWKSIELNPEHSFNVAYTEIGCYLPDKPLTTMDHPDIHKTLEFLDEVGTLMPEEENIKKKIILDACLTDSHPPQENSSMNNFTDETRSRVGWNDKQNVIAADASLGDTEYSFENNELKVSDDQGKRYLHYFKNLRHGYFIGPGADEPVGHFYGICEKFVDTRDPVQLRDDFVFYTNSFVLDPESTEQAKAEKVLNKIKNIIASINKYTERMDNPIYKELLYSDDYFYVLLKFLYDASVSIPNGLGKMLKYVGPLLLDRSLSQFHLDEFHRNPQM